MNKPGTKPHDAYIINRCINRIDDDDDDDNILISIYSRHMMPGKGIQ
jgi:hypothetical protein